MEKVEKKEIHFLHETKLDNFMKLFKSKSGFGSHDNS